MNVSACRSNGMSVESEIEVASIKRKPPIPDSLLHAELIISEFEIFKKESEVREIANTPPNLEFVLVEDMKEQLLKEMSNGISVLDVEGVDWEEAGDDVIEITDENVDDEDVEILTKWESDIENVILFE